MAPGEKGKEGKDRNVYPSMKMNGWHQGKCVLFLKTLSVELWEPQEEKVVPCWDSVQGWVQGEVPECFQGKVGSGGPCITPGLRNKSEVISSPSYSMFV